MHEIYFGRGLIRIFHRGASRVAAGDEARSVRFGYRAGAAFLIALDGRAVPGQFHRIARGCIGDGELALPPQQNGACGNGDVMRACKRPGHSARVANRRSRRCGSCRQTCGDLRRSVRARKALRLLHSVERVHRRGTVHVQVKLRIRVVDPQ